jgi:Glycosyl transferase family 2
MDRCFLQEADRSPEAWPLRKNSLEFHIQMRTAERVPLVSIIMSTRNSAPSMRSVLMQTLHDWELIVIDDGSSDRSSATRLCSHPALESAAADRTADQPNSRLGGAIHYSGPEPVILDSRGNSLND